MTVSDFLPCIFALVSCAAFSVVFEIRDIKMLLSASFSGFVSWLVFTLCAFVGTGIWADTIRYFIATLAVAILAEIFARVHKAPATLFLIIGIIPLVPGGGIYYTMEALINGDMQLFVYKGLSTGACAGAIAVGCSMVSSSVRMITAAIRNEK